MNKCIFFVSLLFAFLSFQSDLIAQDENEPKTLFGNATPVNIDNIGAFVAPSFGFTQMDGTSASLFNLRTGVSFNDKFSLGGYLSTSLNEIQPESETVPGVYMDYWTAGGFLEYTLLSNKLFHFTFPLYVGYGEVEMDNEPGDLDFGESTFWQIEPTALLEVNLHKYARLNIGAGYRFVGQMDYRNFNQSDISGITAYAGLKFGLFR